MDRSEVLKQRKKYCDILYTEQDFERENFTGSRLEGTPKLFSRDYFYVTNYVNSGSFASTDLKFGNFIAN